MPKSQKIIWQGKVIGIQPRIRLLRSFDQRNHQYLGYSLHVQGNIAGEDRIFWIGIGKGAQQKHQLHVGCQISGECSPVEDSRTETVEFYKVSKLKLLDSSTTEDSYPPWQGIPPELEIYRQRGHRRLDVRTYKSNCINCIWGCNMAVEMIIDQWNPSKKKFRQETFCYGPKSCYLYKAGPTRKVPGRKGMSWEEEDWIDEEATSHRGMDD
jgi:hypothetical protein